MDNTILPTGAGGDTIRTIDRTTSKTQVIQLDQGGEAGPESLVTASSGLQVVSGLSLPKYDYASLSGTATQDVWTFKTGGSGGTLVATVTINYTDSTKNTITNVTKT